MSANAGKHRRHRRTPAWSVLPEAELLKLRLRDLKLSASSEYLRPDLEHLYSALSRRGITFKPHVWLSTEWFSPDGIPGIAIPFYAAHPRLARLERRMRDDAEGTNRRWRRRILYHEAGHALDTAYGLRRRSDWRAIFGRASKPYPSAYAVRPASRRFVQHLGHWYAQSHPTEDFAETFAVWLQPKARWRRDYAGWPALNKLEYVDALMGEIAGKRPVNRDRSRVAQLSERQRTLKEHYSRQRSADDMAERRYDPWIKRTFMTRASRPDGTSASRFLREAESKIKARVLARTGVSSYLFAHVEGALRRRTQSLDLVVRGNRRDALAAAVRLHERIVADLLRRNSERYVI